MMIRALSHIEQALTITNSSYPLAAVCALSLRNGPSAERLQTALDILQKHHPLLGSFILEKKGRYWFKKDPEEKRVEVQTIRRSEKNHWRKLVREELNRGFDHRRAPLMRAFYLKASAPADDSEIILSFHHAIMDADFLMSFSDQLLTLAGPDDAWSEQLHQTLSRPSAPSPLLTHVLPANYRKPRVLLPMLSFIFRQVKDEFAYKRTRGYSMDSPIPESSENDITTLNFTEEETIRLIKWSRENQLSVNSILSAAMLAVVNQFNYKQSRQMLRAAQFANLRPFVNPPVPKKVAGSFIAMMRFNVPIPHSLAPEDQIIQMSKDLDTLLRKSLKRGDKYLFSILSKMVIKKSFRDKKERFAATALSYAGPVSLKKTYGGMEVKEMHGFITNNCLGPELSGFGKICFKRLSLDLNFLSSETDNKKALAMSEELKSRLVKLKPKA